MASKIVRSLREVGDINKLADYITEENDLISDTEGVVYVRTKNGFVEITQTLPDGFVEQVQKDIAQNKKDIEDIKVTDQVQYNLIDTNKTNIATNTSDIDTLKNDVVEIREENAEQNTRIEVNKKSIEAIDIYDSGWRDIPLSEGITAYSDKPQYKEINVNDTQFIYLRGSVKGVLGKKIVIGHIPVLKELTNPHYFVQNSSKKKDADGKEIIPFVRWTIQRTGDITYEGVSVDNTLLDGTEWNPINTNYVN